MQTSCGAVEVMGTLMLGLQRFVGSGKGKVTSCHEMHKGSTSTFVILAMCLHCSNL